MTKVSLLVVADSEGLLPHVDFFSERDLAEKMQNAIVARFPGVVRCAIAEHPVATTMEEVDERIKMADEDLKIFDELQGRLTTDGTDTDIETATTV